MELSLVAFWPTPGKWSTSEFPGKTGEQQPEKNHQQIIMYR